MSTALIIAIAYFLILSLGTSIFLKSKVKSGKDFVTGGGTLAWPLVTAGFVLAPLGSGHTLNMWQDSYRMGASVLWWGMISGGIFVPLFLLWFGPWFRRLNVQTFPEGMSKIFGEKIGWLIAAVFPAQLIGICIAEVLATGTAFYALSGEAIALKPYCILLAVGFTILYIIVAGLMQVAWMNLFNAIMLIGGSFAAVIGTGIWLKGRGGWESVTEAYMNAGVGWKTTTILHFSPEVILGLVFPCLFLVVFMCSASQAQYQPMLMAKSSKDIRKGVFIAAFINSMVTYPWVILGLVGMSIPVIAAAGNTLSVPKLAVMALNPVMVGILMISLLSATLSTTSQLILASSHMIVHDVFKKAVNPNMSDRTFLILSRVMIFVCAMLVIFPALKIEGIMSLLLWTFSFAIPVFGVYLIGMIWKVNRFAAWATMLAGYAANFLCTFAPASWWPDFVGEVFKLNVYPTTIATFAVGIVLNLILPGKPGYLKQMDKEEAVSGKNELFA